MELICASGGIVNTDYPKQGIWDIENAGFPALMLDLSSYCLSQDIEYLGKPSKRKKSAEVLEDFSKLRDKVKLAMDARRKDIKVSAVYAPALERGTKREDLNGLIEKLAVESIALCEKYGSDTLIIRPLFAGVDKEDLYEVNREYFLRLAKIAKKSSVTLLFENQLRDIGGHLTRGMFSDPKEAARLIDELNNKLKEERFGFCFDVGAASICGFNMFEYLKDLGGRVKAVILRDIDGIGETSLLPYTGAARNSSKTDWLNFLRGLREIAFDGKIIVNPADTAAAFPPILRPNLLNLAKNVGEYIYTQAGLENILKKYDKIVLFGAGNMCSVYMKYYGKKYPPLFTCDNNPALWGKVACSLTIKEPGALKNLPDGAAILICNMYHREVKAQIEEMGVKNPVEFFSD